MPTKKFQKNNAVVTFCQKRKKNDFKPIKKPLQNVQGL